MQLRAYQQQAVSELFRWFSNNPDGGCPLIVAPTGSGKSLLIAEIARRVCQKRPGNRVLVLAHQKELVQQNAEKLRRVWPEGHVGVYSAGVGRKTRGRVTVASIQTAWRSSSNLEPQTLILIDEAHRAGPERGGMYDQFLEVMQTANPNVRVAGLTATPYRTKTGLLTDDDGIFTDIAYEISLRELVRDGYLSPLVAKSGVNPVDLSRLRTRAGEFDAQDLNREFNVEEKNRLAAEEIVRAGEGRKSWLVFCSGVDHAAEMAQALRALGVEAAAVTGLDSNSNRDQAIAAFKAGKLRALCGAEIFTTGFDHPELDLIAVLRATKSVGLWVQVCGRGCRTAPGKTNCLVLDWGRNAERHGPIDDIRIGKKRNPLTDRDQLLIETTPCKTCPKCQDILPNSTRECPTCGHRFWELDKAPSPEPVMTDVNLPPGYFEGEVSDVTYSVHTNVAGGVSVKVQFALGKAGGSRIKSFCAWYSFTSEKAWRFTVDWWRHWGGKAPMPKTAAEAVRRSDELKTPKVVLYKREEPTEKFDRVSFKLQAIKEFWPQDVAMVENELSVNI